MKSLLAVLMLALLPVLPAAWAEEVDDQYLDIYTMIQQGDALSAKGKAEAARATYIKAETALQQFKAANPGWKTKVVQYRLDYLDSKLAKLEARTPPAAVPAPAATNAATAEPVSPAPAAAAPVELKLKWPVGKRYVQEMTMNQTTEMAVPGMPKPMQTQMDMAQNFSLTGVKERPEGGTEVELKFTSEKVSSKMGGQVQMNFDSKEDPSRDAGNPAAPMFRKMIGQRITFLMDANGKVEKVEGAEALSDKMAEGAPPQTQALFKGMMNEDTLKQYGASALGLPDKPVKVGDTWPVHLEVNAGPLGTMSLNMKYRFAGMEKRLGRTCAVLTYTGDVTTAGASPAANGAEMSVENGKISGKTWFDPDLGMVVESAGDQSMNIKVKTQGQNMTSRMRQKVDSKLLAVEDASK